MIPDVRSDIYTSNGTICILKIITKNTCNYVKYLLNYQKEVLNQFGTFGVEQVLLIHRNYTVVFNK